MSYRYRKQNGKKMVTASGPPMMLQYAIDRAVEILGGPPAVLAPQPVPRPPPPPQHVPPPGMMWNPMYVPMPIYAPPAGPQHQSQTTPSSSPSGASSLLAATSKPLPRPPSSPPPGVKSAGQLFGGPPSSPPPGVESAGQPQPSSPPSPAPEVESAGRGRSRKSKPQPRPPSSPPPGVGVEPTPPPPSSPPSPEVESAGRGRSRVRSAPALQRVRLSQRADAALMPVGAAAKRVDRASRPKTATSGTAEGCSRVRGSRRLRQPLRQHSLLSASLRRSGSARECRIASASCCNSAQEDTTR